MLTFSKTGPFCMRFSIKTAIYDENNAETDGSRAPVPCGLSVCCHAGRGVYGSLRREPGQ